MRKKFTTLLLVMITISGLFASTIRMNYSFDKPEISRHGNYQIISFSNTSLEGETGKAILPFKAVSILLPPGEEVVSVKFIPKNRKEINGKIKLYPKQPSIPISKKTKQNFEENTSFYNSDTVYPKNFNFNQTTQFLNGHSIFMTTISPLKYNPKLQKAFYYQTISVIITSKKTKRAEKSLQNLSNNNIELVKEIIQNKNDLNRYFVKSPRTDDYDLLILSGDNFIDNVSFDSLRTFYFNKGITSNIVSVESIYNSTDGIDNPEKIRNYIIQEYQNHNISYVLLGGDVEIIPYRGFFCHVISGNGVEDNNIPADIYYSALDGNWNNNNNNLWGEPGEEDLLPDVSLARISFSNSEELENQVHKSIFYQSNPVTGELNKQFLVGEDLWQDPQTWGGDYADLLIGYHNDNGYTSDGIPISQPTGKLYDRDLASNWTAPQLLEQLNSGYNFIDHVGHSNATYNMRLSNYDITNANFNLVNGIDHNYQILYTHGCICGSFDTNDCIAERMTNIDNFLVAFVGNSRYGWFNEGQTEGPSEHLNREFINTLYSEKRSEISYAHLRSKVVSAPWVTAPDQWEDGALRWVFYDCNVIGDPLLHIWPDEPRQIEVEYNQQISLNTDNYSVTISNNEGNLSNILCAVIQNNQIIGKNYTDENGIANISLSNNLSVGNAKLSIWGYDLLPTSYDIDIIPQNQPYLTLNNYTFWNGTDENVNIGNQIQLSINYENIGDLDINNVDFILSCDDSYITIISDSINYDENIPANSEVDIPGNFVFDISNNVSDQDIIHLSIQASSENYSWINTLEIPINAPIINIAQALIDDSSENNNHLLDPNENDILHISLENTGHYFTQEGTINLTCNIEGISLDSAQINFENINPEEFFQTDINISVLNPEEDIIPIHLLVTSNFYNIDKIINFSIGYPKENFESGNLYKFNWITSESAWFVSPSNPEEGQYCVQSAEIGNNESSNLDLDVNIISNGNLSFYKYVSSENNYDFLKFYIDGNLINSWSGEIPWSQEIYPLTTGEHHLKWKYKKDGAVSSGQDAAFLDNIVFPAIELPINENTPFKSPRNLTLNLTTKDGALLEWDEPENSDADFTHYNVYRNYEVIATTEDTNFSEELPNSDLIVYYVTASYTNPDGESQPSNSQIAQNSVINAEEVNNITKNKLIGNFPNPFFSGNNRNGNGTKIQYNLQKPAKVELSVYNIKGQLIKRLVNSKQNSGIHNIFWDGQNSQNKNVASGVYFYKLNINNNNVGIKKCLIIK